MRVLICPDSFKGSLSAFDSAEAIAEGFASAMPDAELVTLPLADGGEGTVEALVKATGGRFLHRVVRGPLGEPVDAEYGILGDGKTAVVEMAAASGLILVPAGFRNPLKTSTYGTGELIRAVLDAGCSRLVIGIGGSATNDGGAGALTALGARFLDSAGIELPPGGAALADLATVDLSRLDPRLPRMRIEVACDVTNPLCGPEGASAVYGPQKGATAEMVAELDAALSHYGNVLERILHRSVMDRPGAGAAGGLGAALGGVLGAEMRRGIEIVLGRLDFDRLLEGTDLVVTGEGSLDAQTARGKTIDGVAKAAHARGVPVLALVGTLSDGAEALVDRAAAIMPEGMSLEQAMREARELLRIAAEKAARALPSEPGGRVQSRRRGLPPGSGSALTS